MLRTIEGQTSEAASEERLGESENNDRLSAAQEEEAFFGPVDVSKLQIYEEYR